MIFESEHSFIANSFWIPFLFCEFTINTLFFVNLLLILYLFANSLTIHFEFNSRSHFQFIFFREFIISFANSLRIHYLFRKFTSNSLFFFANLPWIHYFFPNSLWISSPLREFTDNYLGIQFAMNSLSISRILYRFTWCFGYSILIYIFFGNG